MPFNQPVYEPKRQNRFLVSFPKNFGIEPWYVRSVTRPRYTFSIKGKGKWDVMEITFIDPIKPSTSESLFKLTTMVEELKKSQKVGLPLFTFDISTLDPTGVVVENWTIDVRSIVYIDFGMSNYENDDVQTPKMVIRPARCTLDLS